MNSLSIAQSTPNSPNTPTNDIGLSAYTQTRSADVAFTIRGEGNAEGGASVFSLSRSYQQLSAGTVYDQSTGLLWQQRDDGVMRSWSESLQYCNNLNIDGISGWRLPQRAELISIVDYEQIKPPINTRYFPDTKLFNYWASTEYTGTTEHAWTVLFAEGNVYCFRKIMDSYARCVSSNPVWVQ